MQGFVTMQVCVLAHSGVQQWHNRSANSGKCVNHKDSNSLDSSVAVISDTSK